MEVGCGRGVAKETWRVVRLWLVAVVVTRQMSAESGHYL